MSSRRGHPSRGSYGYPFRPASTGYNSTSYTSATSGNNVNRASSTSHGRIGSTSSSILGHGSSRPSTSYSTVNHTSSRPYGSHGQTLTRVDSVSRRRGMAIEDMLNPSREEDTSSASDSSSSDEAEDYRRRPSSSSQRRLASTQSRVSSHRQHSPRSRRQSPPRRGGATSSAQANDVPVRSREFRPKYTEEEDHFMWFHKDDLRFSWEQVHREYKKHFPDAPRDRVNGLQCRYYRVIEKHGCPKKRAQDHMVENSKAYNMWERTRRSYAWMDPYANQLTGKLDISVHKNFQENADRVHEGYRRS